MGKFLSCCTSSNAEDKKDADFTRYGQSNTALHGTGTTGSSSTGHGAGHSATGGGNSPEERYQQIMRELKRGWDDKGGSDSSRRSTTAGATSANGTATQSGAYRNAATDPGSLSVDGSHSSGKGGASFSRANSSASLNGAEGSGGSLKRSEQGAHGLTPSGGEDDKDPVCSGRGLGGVENSSQDLTQPGFGSSSSLSLTGHSADIVSCTPSTQLSSVDGAQSVKEGSASRSAA